MTGLRITFTARARAVPTDGLLIERAPKPDLAIDLRALTSIGFVQIGDDLAPVFEGWWLLGRAEGAIAIADGVAGIGALLRDGGFADVLDAVPEFYALFLMSRPMALRGRGAAAGVVLLDQGQAERLLARGVREPACTIGDLPVVP